jgi:hypothetical protein
MFLRGENPPSSDKEHLIARNFVPKGTLGGQSFNFIFRACRQCNSRKADAKRHVSSVTLFDSPGRLESASVNDVASRKGRNDFHPKKLGVRIEDAHERVSPNTTFGAASIKFGMVGPPSVDKDRVKEVAFSHIQGLFSLICTEDYLDPLKMRLLPEDHFVGFDCYTFRDWGNPRAVEITNRVRDWDCFANVDSAQGYFKAIMRRSDRGWFWALEWNRQLRVLGGISESPMKLFEELPDEGWAPTERGRMRQLVPLDGEHYHLFTGDVQC